MPDDNVLPFAPKDEPPKERQPLINLPPFTRAFVVLLLAIHAGVSFLDPPKQYWVIEHFGFTAAYYTGGLAFGWPALAGPFTFTFIHGGWGHVIINSVMMMAFGAGLEPWMGWKRLAVLMLACNSAALALQFSFDPHSTAPVIGASGALSGLFAAAIIMLQERGGMLTGKYGYWPVIVLWVAVSALFGAIGGPGGETIAWPAHIGGFLTGFALYKPVMRFRR